MRIVMFSINPLFPDYVMGGAPKHLQNIAVYLGELGHTVDVLCTQGDRTRVPFKWHERVTISPLLQFHQPFPQPYATPAYNLSTVIQDVGDFLQQADRFYMHDGEFLFPYVYRHIPTVISLRDNVYPETLIGSFLFQGDHLILISEYSRLYFQYTVGRHFPDLAQRITVIYNGLDWEKFRPTSPDRILEIIQIDPLAQPVIIHPHRPEQSKGIQQTIAVVDLLVHEYGFYDLKVLTPKWLQSQLTPELAKFFDEILREIAARGLQNNFVFHDWIPQELMPQYYSLGTVTLSLGNFVESFGNAVYESLGCGTPAIVARISTHRELVPDQLLDKVDYGDVQAAAAIANRIIQSREKTHTETLQYLYKYYNADRQLRDYADLILKARKLEPLSYQYVPITDNTRFCLAPWCYQSSRGLYHDFLAEYFDLKQLQRLIDHFPNGFSLGEALRNDVNRAEIMDYYRNGFLVAVG